MQVLVVSSSKVKWAKQGTCVLVDNEPTPPDSEGFESPQGWKEVTGMLKYKGGGDYLFPFDQILLINDQDTYCTINTESNRHLGNLKNDKHYLVWFQNLLQEEAWTQKNKAQKKKS
jgi:hypothetical protein